MPRLNEIVKYYIKKDWKLECKYCGSKDELTKDHIIAKSKIPQKVRIQRFLNKDKDENGYFAQFALVCRMCNKIKSDVGHNDFVEHIRKIVRYSNL